MIRPRLGLLLGLLALTAWWSFAPREAGAPVEIAKPAITTSRAAPLSPVARSRVPIGAAIADPFYGPAPKASAPPLPVAVTPPPAPTAPPLPFSFFGRTTGPDGHTQVFLARGKELLTVKEQDVIDGQYRVERITAEEIVFVYLPLAQPQSLRAQQ